MILDTYDYIDIVLWLINMWSKPGARDKSRHKKSKLYLCITLIYFSFYSYTSLTPLCYSYCRQALIYLDMRFY